MSHIKQQILLSLAFLETPGNGGEAPIENNFKILLPSPKVYTLRCVDAEFKKSKVKEDGTGGNPMIQRTWEVVSPEKVMIKDPNSQNPADKIQVGILGLKVMDWLTLSAKAANFVKADCARFGIDPSTLDDENPNFQQYIGKTGTAILSSKSEFMKDAETGEFITVPTTGERKVTYQHRLNEWI